MSAGPVASPLSSRLARLREFWSRVYQKSAEDDIFFMAGAISFNLLIAVVPLFLLAIGSGHDSRALVLDLLRVGSVCPQRGSSPGLHHTQSGKGADSNCLRGPGLKELEDC